MGDLNRRAAELMGWAWGWWECGGCCVGFWAWSKGEDRIGFYEDDPFVPLVDIEHAFMLVEKIEESIRPDCFNIEFLAGSYRMTILMSDRPVEDIFSVVGDVCDTITEAITSAFIMAMEAKND